MKKKKFIGKLISIKYTDRETPYYGFVIDYNDDWTLMKYNYTDYEMDGYVILRHKNIDGYRRSETERFREKIIKLKGQQSTEKEIIPITDLKTILSYLTKKFGIFLFYLKSEKRCYVGKLSSLNSNALIIDYMDPKGKWAKQMTFRPGDIRTIEFSTDYINSLKLFSDSMKRKKRASPKI